MQTTELSNKENHGNRHGWNISEWCDLYGFSRTFYYKLAKQGNAPVTVSVGGLRIITVEADVFWRVKQSTRPQ